jgi:hypothetical protein
MNSKSFYGAVLLGIVASIFVACGDGDSTRILICTQRQVTCLNDRGGEVCSADGTLKLPFSCGVGEKCCNPSRDEDCRDYEAGEGGENSSVPDQAGCVSGCVPGTRECSSDEVARVCAEDGRAWIPVACPAGTGCVDGECTRTNEPDDTVTVCEEGQSSCVDGGTVKDCEADGSAWVYKPCPTGTACIDGACAVNEDVECVPNSGVCANRSTARICNTEGTGYTEVDCGDMECLDGACRGPVCSMGEIRCDDVREGNVLAGLSSSSCSLNYQPTLVYECNRDGTAWTISECGPTEVCAYDNIAATTVNAYVEEVKTALRAGESVPLFQVPETSRAACVQPDCASPFALREFVSSCVSNTGGSFLCGEPGGNDLDSFTLCEGLLPFNNLHWANYVCPDGTECSYEGNPNQSEEGGVVLGPVCHQDCRPGTTACFSIGSGGVGQVATSGEATIDCGPDGEWDFSTIETCARKNDTDLGREQWCGPSLKGTDESYNIGQCMDPACAYWFGAYDTFALPDGVGACGKDGLFYQCRQDGTFAEGRPCGFCSLTTAPGSTNPDTYGGYDPGTCSDCVTGQQACVIPNSTSGGSPYYTQCGRNGEITVETCSGGAPCRDFTDRDPDSDTYGLSRIICGGECTPFDTECGTTFETLKMIRFCDDGTWTDFMDCEDGACTEDNTTGAGHASCEAECIPGTFTCPSFRGAQAVECLSSGRYDDLNPFDCDVAAGESCIEGLGCRQCDDGSTGNRIETRCNPDDLTQIQVCDGNGWADPVDCPGDPGSCVSNGTASYCAPDLGSGGTGGTAGAGGGSGTGGDAGSTSVGGTSGAGGTGGDAGTGGTGGTGGDVGAGAGGTAGDINLGGFGNVGLG